MVGIWTTIKCSFQILDQIVAFIIMSYLDSSLHWSVTDKNFTQHFKTYFKMTARLCYWSSVQLKLNQSNYTPLYEKDPKQNQYSPMETTQTLIS